MSEVLATRVLIRDGRVEQSLLRKARLRLRGSLGRRKSHVIEDRVCRVGSHEGNEIILDHPSVSRFHAVIELHDKGFGLRDLDSTNGTWAGGLRIREAWLAPGAVVSFGDVTGQFDPLEDEASIDLSAADSFGRMIGRSTRMREIFRKLEALARSDMTVLLLGETGTGKELAARAIHEASRRRDQPFVTFDASAVPAGLVERELFGHMKGAYTGADSGLPGLVAEAEGGTLFLDEIGELPPDLQPKLLRLLEAREYRPVGSTKPKTADIRVVAATNRELGAEVNQGRFRADLYFRLAVAEVRLPPLRERPEDIPLIARRLTEDLAPSAVFLEMERRAPGEFWEQLARRPWPGNVRELRNYIEVAMASIDWPADGEAAPADADATATEPSGDWWNARLPYHEAKEKILERFNRRYVGEILRETNFNVSETARRSGLTRVHVQNLMRRYQLREGAKDI